ncbi:ABC transporter permease [Endobacter medicaginis]|nr:ABC transporter permease [Endobacter medicaginis]MCX5474685.1 ABC transporter permease [Endobacter medicaginis]NVN29757.1 ABC transporter permease [Endobacter medicaginis]
MPPWARTALSRIATAALSLWILVTLTFFLAHLTPGGPAYAILGMRATPVGVNQVNMRLGLDVPLWMQYLTYLGHLCTLRLGYSFLLNQPVAHLIVMYAANTLLFTSLSIVVGTLAALAIGMVQGASWNRWPGRLIGAWQLATYATPSFFIAGMLVLVFASTLGWLPAGGITDAHMTEPGPLSYARHLVLPVATVSLIVAASLSRYFGQSVAEELERDYVRTARAKGLGLRDILRGEVARNALRPFITLLGLYLPALFAGSVVVETIFDFPGLGWLLWHAALQQDYPTLIGVVLLIGALTIVGNLAAELANAALDPRLRSRTLA